MDTVFGCFGTDGEEAVRSWNMDNDAVYGTKHLARTGRRTEPTRRSKAFLVAELIGDADLNMSGRRIPPRGWKT